MCPPTDASLEEHKHAHTTHTLTRWGKEDYGMLGTKLGSDKHKPMHIAAVTEPIRQAHSCTLAPHRQQV